MSIRRTDARRTPTLTRDQGNGIRDLALFPFLWTLFSFYVRFVRYVSVLYLTLTSFRFRDERRQRGEHVTRTQSAVEEPPSRSRAVFHPSSSLHYLILWAFSCHSYPLISPLIHIPLLCSFHLPSRQVLRARSRGFDATPIFSSLPDCLTNYKTIPFTPLWYGGPSPLTHTLHGALHTQALACVLSLLYRT